MRIHLNLDHADAMRVTSEAARAAGVHLERRTSHGSRTHALAVDVILSGDSPHRINFGTEYAASWDQWGIFLANIYAADPTAKSWAYGSANDFHRTTGQRFDGVITSRTSPGYQRTSHKWWADFPGSTSWHCVNGKHGACTASLTR